MDEILERIQQIEAQIEEALWSLEVDGQLESALAAYHAAESHLNALHTEGETPGFHEQQRVLAYCLMRQGNILRQLGSGDEALELAEREMHAARRSGDEIMLARSMLSFGTNQFAAGKVERGLEYMRAARDLFECGDSYDHMQGLGWYWILQADLANAGMLSSEPTEVLAMTGRALALLEPIENWPGVARAYAARAIAHQQLGEEESAAADRRQQQVAESKIES
jgi:tetratricopeptide (TPR) repeat protein